MNYHGFNHRAIAVLPEWALPLTNHYYRIRVEPRNKTQRRKSYRAIEKIKLKLVESGIPFSHVDAVCKYLVSLKESNAQNLAKVLSEPIFQQNLPF